MSFSADITRFIARTNLRADVVLRTLAFDTLDTLLWRSPVDTGRFRGSWRVGINVVDPSVEGEYGPYLDPSSIEAMALAKLSLAKFGSTIHLSNNLPYATALEDGHSKQAPAGMLGLTFQDLVAHVSQLVKSVEGV